MSYHHLSRKERGIIALMWNNRSTMRQIAQALGKNVSTISREIKRNRTEERYKSAAAHEKYIQRRKNCVRTRGYENPKLQSYVSDKLQLAWSPEQIAGRILLDYPEDSTMRISLASIYRWLRQGLMPCSACLERNLRHYGHHHGEKRGMKVGARELKTRCREALRRQRLGDWEVDTIVYGHSAKHLLDMVDRKSRYCCLLLLHNTRKKDMMRAFSLFFEDGRLPLKTATSDRGAEFNCHNEFEKKFHALFYYTRPASPWQKPTVENTNGLVRQFFPKGLDPAELSQDDVARVMQLLNNRPRKCLGFKTPAEVLHFT